MGVEVVVGVGVGGRGCPCDGEGVGHPKGYAGEIGVHVASWRGRPGPSSVEDYSTGFSGESFDDDSGETSFECIVSVNDVRESHDPVGCPNQADEDDKGKLR